MTTQEMFASVDEKALESVSGGLLDVLNYALNGNHLSIGSNLQLGLMIGDVLSNIGNIANEVTGAMHAVKGAH